MKYQIGDRVMLLHSGEEGHIVDFINNRMVTVEVDGVTFPVFIDQIDFPYFKDFTQRKPAPKPPAKPVIEDIRKEKPSSRQAVSPGVWISFLPVYDKHITDEDIVDYFRVSLVNQTEEHLVFSYRLMHQDRVDFELRNEVLPLSDIYLHDVRLEEMNEAPRFVFDFTLKEADRKRASRKEVTFRMKAKQLFKQLQELQQRQAAHFSELLFARWPDRHEEPLPEPPRYPMAPASSGLRSHVKASSGMVQSVVDLHIEKLSVNHKGMLPQEILDLQIATFEKYLDLAIAHLQPKLTVIHGVGTGRLRDEIHQILRYRREVSSFVHQYHPLFGNGATEIYLQQL